MSIEGKTATPGLLIFNPTEAQRMMHLRVCSAAMPHMVSRDQDGRLTGFLAPAILESLQLFRYRFHVTLMFSDKIGEVINGSDYRYDGCLWSGSTE